MPKIWFQLGIRTKAGTMAGVSKFGANFDVAGFAVPYKFKPSILPEIISFLKSKSCKEILSWLSGWLRRIYIDRLGIGLFVAKVSIKFMLVLINWVDSSVI